MKIIDWLKFNKNKWKKNYVFGNVYEIVQEEPIVVAEEKFVYTAPPVVSNI